MLPTKAWNCLRSSSKVLYPIPFGSWLFFQGHNRFSLVLCWQNIQRDQFVSDTFLAYFGAGEHVGSTIMNLLDIFKWCNFTVLQSVLQHAVLKHFYSIQSCIRSFTCKGKISISSLRHTTYTSIKTNYLFSSQHTLWQTKHTPARERCTSTLQHAMHSIVFCWSCPVPKLFHLNLRILWEICCT